MKGMDNPTVISPSWYTTLQINQCELPSLLAQSKILTSWLLALFRLLKSTPCAVQCNTQHRLACLQLLFIHDYMSMRIHIIYKWLQLIYTTPLEAIHSEISYKNSIMVCLWATYPSFLHNTQYNYTIPYQDTIEVRFWGKYCIYIIIE